MKILLPLLLLIFPFPSFSQEPDWIPFQWHEEVISGKHLDKAAIYILVTLDGLSHKFYMQFDLGSDATMIYGNAIKPYLHEYESLKSKITELEGDKQYFKDIELKIGEHSIGKQTILYRKGVGNSLGKRALNQSEAVLIGTIGTDIFTGKILVIDYPNKRICVTNEIPEKYTSTPLQSFKTKYGKVVIAVDMDGKKKDLLYDTGSSIFAIATTEENADIISEKTNVDSFDIYAWGKRYMVYGRPITSTVTLGEKQLKPALVYFDKKGHNENTNKILGVWGVVGNAYFTDNTVIIDWRNKLFGIQ
jgi:hypothetical protein